MLEYRFFVFTLLMAGAMLVASLEPDVETGVQQIHLALGKDPTVMTISWLTPYNATVPKSQVSWE